MKICLKRREAPIDYTIDWGRGWMGTAAIHASRWTIAADGRGDDPDGGGAVVIAIDAGEGRTRATITGGMPGAFYTVRGHVELTDGRRAVRALSLQIGAGR